jgi:uncharacterized protein (DUF4415 family)
MNESKHVLGSDLKKIDTHIITPDEYTEIPELSDEFFEQADLYAGDKLVQRGRPRSENCKELVAIRYDSEVLAAFRATGKGWQTRMNDALKEWLKEQSTGLQS